MEVNYDEGNKKLREVLLALQELRHWLESSVQPFLIWADHKNLSYLKNAKRLNSRQAWWAVFLGLFRFSLTYHPGSRNTKPDALSRLVSPDPSHSEPSSIVLLSCVVEAASWLVERRVLEATSDPGNGPPNPFFVPDRVWSEVGEFFQTYLPLWALTDSCISLGNTSDGFPWLERPRPI